MIAAMKKRTTRAASAFAFALPLASILVLAACGGGGSSPPAGALEAQGAKLSPAASCTYSHVWVTVVSVSVLDAATQAWSTVALPAPMRIDLLAASGGVLQALGAAPLQPGHYSQLRLVLAAQGNSVQLAGAGESALKVPGGSASGLKLAGDLVVAAGTTGDVAIASFDPCSAIVTTGKGSYNLKPEAEAVVKPVMQAAPESAGPAGQVLHVPGGGNATADLNGNVVTFRRFDAAGNAAGQTQIVVNEPVFTWYAALKGGGYAAVWIALWNNSGTQQVITQAWSATGASVGPQSVALVDPGRLAHPAALPRIAPLDDGGYVLAWGLPVADNGVYAQRFTSTGVAANTPIRVAESGTGSLGLANLASGGYVVSWGRLDSPSGGVQVFSAADVPAGPAQSAGSNGDGGGPPIPVLQGLAGGGAVIAWQAVHEHLMMQQVAADGSPVTGAQVVDDLTTSPVFVSVAIGALPDGGSVIAWTQSDGNVYARRYLASGAAAGPQTRINLVSTSAAGPVGVAVHADGSFEVHWNALDSGGTRQWWSRLFAAGSLMG
jgi:hypothetical protein